MRKALIRISHGLALPLDWITLATVIYGARGSGKTSLGRVFAEEATKARLRFCAIDLKGDWWGLKSSADGKEYHPDPEINAQVAQEALDAEAFDMKVGYPPRRWTCPCGKSHSRGHLFAIGVHRCLSCGYVGPDGVMSLPDGGT